MISDVIIKWVRVSFNLVALLSPVAPLYVIWLLWRMISLVFPAHIYQIGDDLVFEFYQRFSLVLTETFVQFQLSLYGDFERIIDKKERFLLLSNHQSATDWIVGNCITERLGRLGQLRYFMKDVLQIIPLYGFYFHHHGCIYVNRKQCNFEKMRRTLLYLQNKQIPSIVVIFPEGTRYQADRLIESHEFAEKNGLRKLNHVRYPRTRGLGMTICYLRPNIDAIYDVTIIYGGTKDGNRRLSAPSLIDVFTGRCRSVHAYLERIPIENVPEDEQKIRDFLFTQFNKKEDLLSRYYDNRDANPANDCQPFPGPALRRDLSQFRQSIALILMFLFSTFSIFTGSGLSMTFHVWIVGTLFGYVWLFIGSVA